VRISGNNASQVFSGKFVDLNTAANQRAAIVLNQAAANTLLRLSGDNSGATGDVLFQASNTAIRLESANALPPSSLLRFETASVNMVVELAFGDLTRSANNTTGNGGMNLTVGNGAGGFAAVGADRKVTLVGGGTIVWGTQGFAPTSSNGNSSGFQ